MLLPANPEEEKTECICGKNDGNKLWACCDNCQGWFHPECLGATKQEIEQLQKGDENDLWFHSEECKV